VVDRFPERPFADQNLMRRRQSAPSLKCRIVVNSASVPVVKWLFKKNRRKQIVDPLFGTLEFVEAKNPSDSFWEGRGRFSPIASDVAYWIKAGDSGPSGSHRAVYRHIEKRYGELLLLVKPLLDREYAAQMEGSDLPPGPARFSLDILHIPAVESESMEWSLDFSCDQWDDALFTVHMNGWLPTGKVAVMD
jgi:hypothetical protein